MTDGVTYVTPSTTAPTLPNGVIAAEQLHGEGDAPGAVAYVHKEDFGPTLVQELWERSRAGGVE